MTNQGLAGMGRHMIRGRSRWVSVGKRKDIFKFFKTGEMKVEAIKNAENWRSKRRKLKDLLSDGLDLLREESNKNSGTYVQEFLLHVYLEVKRAN